MFYSPDGPDTLIETYDAVDEPSTIRCYGLNTSTSELYLRVARNVVWVESDGIPFDSI